MSAAQLPSVAASASARTIHAVRPSGLPALLERLGDAEREFLAATGFAAKAQELILLPGAGGVAGAVLGLGDERGPFVFGDLAFRLPPGEWAFAPGDFDAAAAVTGFCLGGYRYRAFKSPGREPARVVAGPDNEAALSAARAAYLVRDLINAPANVLGPSELADAALRLAGEFGANGQLVQGDALRREYPTVATVGQGSERSPVVASFAWKSRLAGEDAPLISLCGKGVCFDTGGYDLKPSSGMLRMKKDMGGAATALGLAHAIMASDLPVRLAVRIGCVENSVSGTAMRPLDVVRTRRGHTVEIGNTDAEGRLVLCDLLAEASDERPALLIDFATLTGAARVALGPELPALFCNDDATAEALLESGRLTHDPMWRLPLWDGYDSWLDSNVADFGNVSSKPMAGAVTAALFLRRFVAAGVRWAHLDIYAWNDNTRPGRPEGGEAQTIRALLYAVEHKLEAMILK
ncbi:MAG: leucyl aminopeptidase family protein [Acidisphaera sp.]|nr:leucyl aminopeptidase family protein [Acidisphaera sp.]MBV9813889.1 leucyl aminopeptidase family protein [Acetobacteraceae bacterium]